MGRSAKSQNMLIFLCWAVYVISHLGKYSYSSNISSIMNEYGVTHADAGLVTTFLFFSYGIGQIANAVLCKKYNKRTLFPIALFGTAIINIAIYSGIFPFYTFKFLWLINGFLHSCLWPTLILIMSEELDSFHLPKSVTVMGTSTASGVLLSYGLSALCTKLGNYKLAFLVGPVLMIVIGIVWLILYTPTKSEIPKPAVKETYVKEKKKNALGFGIVIILVMLAFFAIAENFVKDGLQTWVPAMLNEIYEMPASFSILLTLLLPILGIFGTVCVVNLYKKIKNFVTLAAVFFGAATALVGLIIAFYTYSAAVTVISFGLVVLTMFAVNNVITSMAPLYMRDKLNSGTLAGLLNACCYVGSAIASYGLGAVADNSGWNTVFFLILSILGVCTVTGVVYSLVTLKKKAL